MMAMKNTEDYIQDVIVKSLQSHGDERGFFREIIRSTDPLFEGGNFGQWSHSKMQRDVVKAWHYHHVQTDWWYVPYGYVEAVLYDNREESPTYKQKLILPMGEKAKFTVASEVCVRIPPGVLHGLRVFSDEAHLFYITSTTYNPNDEGRFPYNTFVPHDWGSNAIVVENDKRAFVPTATRALVR